jgi:hypothetical protein
MARDGSWTDVDEAPTLLTSDEEVVMHVRRFAVLRAVYEAEGYYDGSADGDPDEQDLFRIEVLDATRATDAAEAMEGAAVWPLAELGLTHTEVRRLFPASRWTATGESSALAAQYLLALAHALIDAATPAGRERVLEESVGWPAAMIQSCCDALPHAWRPLLRR